MPLNFQSIITVIFIDCNLRLCQCLKVSIIRPEIEITLKCITLVPGDLIQDGKIFLAFLRVEELFHGLDQGKVLVSSD